MTWEKDHVSLNDAQGREAEEVKIASRLGAFFFILVLGILGLCLFAGLTLLSSPPPS